MFRRAHRRFALLTTLARTTTALTAHGVHARPSRPYFGHPHLCFGSSLCTVVSLAYLWLWLNRLVALMHEDPLIRWRERRTPRIVNAFLLIYRRESPQSLIASEGVRCVFYVNNLPFVPLMGLKCGRHRMGIPHLGRQSPWRVCAEQNVRVCPSAVWQARLGASKVFNQSVQHNDAQPH